MSYTVPALPVVCTPPGTRRLYGCCLSALSRWVLLRTTINPRLCRRRKRRSVDSATPALANAVCSGLAVGTSTDAGGVVRASGDRGLSAQLALLELVLTLTLFAACALHVRARLRNAKEALA